MSIFDATTWKKFGEGFSLYDCAFGYGNRYAFLMYEKQDSPHRDPLPRLRFLMARMERPVERRFYFSEFGHFQFARLAYGESPETEFVSVDTFGHVYGYNPPRSDKEHAHPLTVKGSELSALVNQVVRVGTSIYTVGGPRKVHKRVGIGQWQELTDKIPTPKSFINPDANLADYFWNDLSGFAENDMYAAGGAGDVWHYNGKRWSKLSFLSNERLYNVHCAANGLVYIGGNMGSLYVGRDNSWKKLSGGDFSVHWKDIAWFAGQLWCGSDYGLWTLGVGDRLERAKVPAEVQLSAGAIDIAPDGKLMLTAGPDGASLFDGKAWQVLFNRQDFE